MTFEQVIDRANETETYYDSKEEGAETKVANKSEDGRVVTPVFRITLDEDTCKRIVATGGIQNATGQNSNRSMSVTNNGSDSGGGGLFARKCYNCGQTGVRLVEPNMKCEGKQVKGDH